MFAVRPVVGARQTYMFAVRPVRGARQTYKFAVHFLSAHGKVTIFFLISILFLISPLQRHYFVLYIPIYTFLDMFTIFNNFLSFKDFFRRSQI
jgi:hypothetical protein